MTTVPRAVVVVTMDGTLFPLTLSTARAVDLIWKYDRDLENKSSLGELDSLTALRTVGSLTSLQRRIRRHYQPHRILELHNSRWLDVDLFRISFAYSGITKCLAATRAHPGGWEGTADTRTCHLTAIFSGALTWLLLRRVEFQTWWCCRWWSWETRRWKSW